MNHAESIRYRLAIAVLLAACLNGFPGFARGEDVRESEVGMPARIEQLVLPGEELEAKPLEDRKAAIIVRILSVFPHGNAHRYDLEYYGLEPGEFDLRDSLQRRDGAAMENIPKVLVNIVPTLPPGQVKPNALERRKASDLGGYRVAWAIGGLLWFLGLFAILFLGRRKKHQAEGETTKPRTLAERLRPSVEKAIAGDLPPAKLAELERLLVSFWRRRLDLHSVDASQAIQTLREHPEAGAMLQQLELWLHHPEGGSQVDVAKLLEPYQDLPPDALDE